MFLCSGVAFGDLIGIHQANGNAAAVIAVVRLGHYRITKALGCGHRAFGGAHQTLLRHRQAMRRQNLVGLFLVARQLHRDITGAPGDGGLHPLLAFAVTQLNQRLLVHAQPRNAACFGRAHQRHGRWPQRTALRVANVFVARGRPMPIIGHRILGPQILRQQ